MADGNVPYLLRPEAGPVPYNKLQERARKTLELIILTLEAAAQSAARTNGAEGEATANEVFIDTHRASRLFFVSGEPGSGKSTLYLTLKAMHSPNKRRSSKYSQGYGRDTSILKEAVRWLEPIDLEVSGEEGENLLAAVLVRFIRSLDESSPDFSKACGDALKKLEELATDIGMAWDGNLHARAGELDPDAYSMEVMRSQRARLGINERLRETLNELAKHDCCGCHPGTLFVLPIDDFYLRPDASLQLLRLLRMISVPRLFFLVMGDITTVEALFVEKALADWTAVAGAEIFAALPERKQEVLARARELRARFLRKLLPPGQRATIEPMDWNEAMKFKPEVADSDTDDWEELRTLLGKVNLDEPKTADSSGDHASSPASLLDFLAGRDSGGGTVDSPKRIGEETGQEKEAREAYTGLQILDATPREIMDIWTALQQYIVESEHNLQPQHQETDHKEAAHISAHGKAGAKALPLLSMVVNFVKLTIEEQNFLNEQQQQALSGVLPTRHYYAPDTFLETDRLRLGPEGRSWKIAGEVRVRNHSPWKLMVGKVQPRTDIAFAKLPPRPTAWIILLHDLAWKWSRESMSVNLVETLTTELNPEAVTVLATEPPEEFRWAAWWNGKSWQHFPMPPFKTFQQLDRFLHVWNRGLDWWSQEYDSKLTSNRSLRDVIDLWALAGWTVIGNHYEDFVLRSAEWPERVLREFKQTDTESSSSNSWLLEVTAFEERIVGREER
jgi:hypothetical protein